MDESDLKRVDSIEQGRLNGHRVSRVAHELFVSATDPMTTLRKVCLTIAALLVIAGGAFALLGAFLPH